MRPFLLFINGAFYSEQTVKISTKLSYKYLFFFFDNNLNSDFFYIYRSYQELVKSNLKTICMPSHIYNVETITLYILCLE